MIATPVRRTRPALDVSSLPTVVFGNRDLMWWGTAGFMLIEGFTLALVAASYLYLRKNFDAWPPVGTPRPSLGVPIAQVLVMLVSLAPAWWAKRAARRLDRAGVLLGLAVQSVVCLATLPLRWYEFWAINTRWDQNAYGSAAWAVVGFHATLLLLDVVETVGLTALFVIGPVEDKHFTDAADNTNYWYFTVASWLPLFVLVYLSPYFM